MDARLEKSFFKVLSEEYAKVMSGCNPKTLTDMQKKEINIEALQSAFARLGKAGDLLKEGDSHFREFMREQSMGHLNGDRDLTPKTPLQILGAEVRNVLSKVAQGYRNQIKREAAANGNGSSPHLFIPVPPMQTELFSEPDSSKADTTPGASRKRGEFVRLYMFLVEKYPHLPSDEMLMDLCRVKIGAVTSARRKARGLHYDIEKVQEPTDCCYWSVTKPPKEEESPPAAPVVLPDGGPLPVSQLEEMMERRFEEMMERAEKRLIDRLEKFWLSN